MQGFIITAYKDYESLRIFLKEWSPYVQCYVHVDARSVISQKQCDDLSGIPGVHIYRKYRVHWGSMAHLKAIRFLMEQALEDPGISYFHVISAQDFPACSHSDFIARFESNEYIYMQRLMTEHFPQLEFRYRHYHFMDLLDYQDKRDSVQNWVGRIDRWQEKAGIRRSFIPKWKGLVWVSMPRKSAEWAIKSEYAKKLIKKLKFTYIPEEFFFQNVFNETDFEKDIVNHSLRFSRWDNTESSSPEVLDIPDLSQIDASECVFARKIAADTELYQRLSERWKK